MLAELLSMDHVWRADLIAFDEFSSYATKVRYPTPGGGMPLDPEHDELESGWNSVSLLVDEIEDWCDERLEQRSSGKF